MSKATDRPKTAARDDDFFALLGLSKEASLLEVRRAYRRRARRLHPDHGGDTQAFIALTRAYQTLVDPELRRRYAAKDQATRVAWTPPPPPPLSPASAKRAGLPWLWALPLLIMAAFALDFAFRLSTPPHVLHANRTVTDAYQRQAASPNAAGVANGEHPPFVAGGNEAMLALWLPAAEGRPATWPDGGSAESTAVDAQRVEKLIMPAQSAAKPSDQAKGATHLVLFYAPNVNPEFAYALAAFLQQQGYRLSAPAPKAFAGQSRVRFFHAADRAAAATLRRLIQTFQDRPNNPATFPLRLSNSALHHPEAPRGLLELWMGLPPPVETVGTPTADETTKDQAQTSLDERLQAFVQAYGRAYTSRDVVQVAALFHKDAQENGRPIETVLPIYQSNMEQIKNIDYRIELDDYRQEGNSEALHIKGRFFAHLELPDRQVRKGHGTIAMQLLPYGQSFLIKQLDYRLASR